MILHNLITKFSFENSISDSKTGGVGTDVSYAPGIKGKHIKDLLAFIAYNNSKSFDCYKSITVSMWIKTNPHTEEHNLYLCYQNH
jgi:hypothetical protein